MNLPLFKQVKSTYVLNNQVSPIKSLGQQEDQTISNDSPKNQTLDSGDPFQQKRALPNLGSQKQSMFKTASQSQSSRPSALSFMKQNKKWETIKDMYNAQKFQNMQLV